MRISSDIDHFFLPLKFKNGFWPYKTQGNFLRSLLWVTEITRGGVLDKYNNNVISRTRNKNHFMFET